MARRQRLSLPVKRKVVKHKLIALSFVIFLLSVFTVLTGPLYSSFAASEANAGAQPLPTPASKRAKIKTIRELTFTDGEFDGQAMVRTEAEWKALLTATEFYIMRQEGTERAYTGELTANKKHGTYYCAACGLALFSSDAKYDSETGWPSFFQPIFKKNVAEKVDNSLSEERTEVECARCHAHLGHVFDDGPEPTGLRYCMNSVSLKFKQK